MKKKTKFGLSLALVLALLSILIALLLTIQTSGGSGPLSGLAIMGLVFGAMAALPAALVGFLLGYFSQPLLEKLKGNPVPTSELLSNAQAFEKWQEEVEKKGN